MYTCEPLRRYSPATSARRPKSATRCHSVRSCCSPVCLSRQLSLVAMRRLATVVPDGMARVSGSAPRLPMRMTLLMPRAMVRVLELWEVTDRSTAAPAGQAAHFRGGRPAARTGVRRQIRQKDAFGYSRGMVRTLTDPEIARVLTYERLIPAMERALTAFSSGQVTQPVRSLIPIEHGQRYLGVMPAVMSESMGAKLVCFYPKNAAA